MVARLTNCIYCHAAVDVERGQGDHVVPAALGRFENEFIFRSICRGCNSVIGKCEEQLLRCAPEAFVRRVVNPSVRRQNRGTSWVGANGMPPPRFTIDHGTHHELVDGSSDDPRNVRPIDQLVFVDKNKQEHHIRLFPEMTAAHLRAKIEAVGVEPSPEGSFLHADEATWPKYVALLQEIWKNSMLVESEGKEQGVHRMRGRTTFTFHSDYWRAIAKIGFHYYLVNTRRGFRGDEPAFAEVRRFIIEGGDRDRFFTKPETQFLMPFRELPDGRAIVPPVWTHVLAADETYQVSVAMVSLFMGPKRIAPSFHINLGRHDSKLIVPGARWTHTYVYNGEAKGGTYAGRVVAETLTQIG